MAPRVGIEPTTNGLTVRRSTAELPGNRRAFRRRRILRHSPRLSQGTEHAALRAGICQSRDGLPRWTGALRATLPWLARCCALGLCAPQKGAAESSAVSAHDPSGMARLVVA